MTAGAWTTSRRPSLAANVAANYGGRLVAGGLGLAFPPFFARILGAEAYGLVGFATSLYALMLVLDLGLSATMQRELAVVLARPSEASLAHAGRIVRAFATAFWMVGGLLGVGVALGARPIARHWLQAGALPESTVVAALHGMAVVVALQWPASLYSGALVGLQQQVRSNVALALGTTIRFVGAALVLALVSPSVEAFFAWQAASQLAQVWLLRSFVRSALPVRVGLDLRTITGAWRLSIGLWAVSLLMVVMNQADKLAGSSRLPLVEFGYYSLAATVATGIVYVSTPIWVAYFPRLCELGALGDRPRLERAYHEGAQLMTAAIAPAAVVISLFAPEILFAWTGDAAVVARIRGPAVLLVLGASATALMYVPYALQVAFARTLAAAAASGAVLAGMVLALPLAAEHGATALAAAWLAGMALHGAALAAYTHTTILRRHGMRWLVQDLGLPALGALAAALAARVLLPPVSTRLGGAAVALAATVPAALAAVLLAPDLRHRLRAALPAPPP